MSTASSRSLDGVVAWLKKSAVQRHSESLIQANFSGFACAHVLLTASAGSPLNSHCLNLSEFSCMSFLAKGGNPEKTLKISKII
ncbi:hypothetical protein [Rickettsia endosymbiont of Aspidapion aeneum]